jgi:hypothetical protein
MLVAGACETAVSPLCKRCALLPNAGGTVSLPSLLSWVFFGNKTHDCDRVFGTVLTAPITSSGDCSQCSSGWRCFSPASCCMPIMTRTLLTTRSWGRSTENLAQRFAERLGADHSIARSPTLRKFRNATKTGALFAQSDCGLAPYCSSETFSNQATCAPSSASCRAMWTIAVVGAAPCQCFSPGGIHTVSPGLISRIGPPHA